MNVYLDGKKLFSDVPDNLMVNDSILDDDKVYFITSKTWDNKNKELYCKVEESKNETLIDILSEIYDSHHITTSGQNTNDIKGNPTTIILMTIAGLIIESTHFNENYKKYYDNLLHNWSDKIIDFNKIFNDNPPLNTTDINIIKLTASKILTQLKIDKKLWPKL